MSMAAEVSTKVTDIVDANVQAFRRLYKPLIRDLGTVSRSECTGTKWTRDMTAQTQMRLLNDVPRAIRDAARLRLRAQGGLKQLAQCEAKAVGDALVEAAARVVARTSARQAMKGFLTAGLVNSARYVVSKVGKSWKARARNRKALQQQLPG